MNKRIIAVLLTLMMIMPMQTFALEYDGSAAADVQSDTEATGELSDDMQDEDPSGKASDSADSGQPPEQSDVSEEKDPYDLAEEVGDIESEETALEEEESGGIDAANAAAGEWTAEDFTYADVYIHRNSESKESFEDWGFDISYADGSDKDFAIHVISGLSESGTAKIGTNKDLVIPAKDPAGRQIQGVGKYVFQKQGLTSVKFPSVHTSNDLWDSSVSTRGDFFIGYYAFNGNELTSLELPEGVLVVCGGAFGGNNLTKVKFPTTIRLIAGTAFSKNSITGLEFTRTTTFPLQIDNQAFTGNKIEEVYLPDKTNKVTKWAFLQNTGKEAVSDEANAAEKLGGVVYMYINDPGEHVDAVNNNRSYVQKIAGGNTVSTDPDTAQTGSGENGETSGDNKQDEPAEDPSDTQDEPDASVWTSDDFTYGELSQRLYGCDYSRDFTITGIAVTGFSEQGEAKLKKNTDLVIPSRDADGNTIAGIGTGAFKNKGLTSVTFPTGMLVDYDDELTGYVTKRGNFVISESAFYGNKLRSVTLPDGVIAVMTSAFQYNELETVTLPKTIWWVETMSFARNNISKVNFPSETYFQFEMHGWPFAFNNIESVKLPNHTKVVNKYTFQNNPGVVRLTEDQLKKAYNATAYAKLTDEDKEKIGTVYMYIDAVDPEDALDRIHHIDQETESTKSYFQKLIVNDGSGGTQYQDDEAWSIQDFTVSGTKITGLSASGIAKRKINKDLVIPENNASGKQITEIAASTNTSGGLFATATEKFDTVTLPTGLLKIGNNAFREAGLSDVAFPPYLQSIGTTAFQMNKLTSVILPDTVTYVGQGAFASNSSIERINLSAGLKEIADGAFGCSDMNNWMTGLTEIRIPDGVTRIGNNAFAGNNFSSITIPEGVTEIGEYAFSTKNYLLEQQESYCTVELPDSLTTIGNRAFRNKNVAVVHLPESVKALGAETFEKVLSTYGTPDKAGSTKYDLTTRVYVTSEAQAEDKVNFPASDYHTITLIDYNVWTAGDFEFEGSTVTGLSQQGLDKLSKNGRLTIPAEDAGENAITAIGSGAFRDAGITSVAIPEGIASIGKDAFRDNKITRLTIPTSVTMIGDNAFRSNRISSVGFDAESAEDLVIGAGTFADNELMAVQLPDKTKSADGTAFSGNKGIDGTVNVYVNDPGAGVASSDSQKVVAGEAMPDGSGSWTVSDFAYDAAGTTITGLSAQGKMKYASNRNLRLPDKGPSGKYITAIGDNAFAVAEENVDVGKYDYNTTEGIESVVLPAKLEKIGKNAFIYNSLTNVDFARATSLTSVGETAFKGNHLQKVMLTDNVTELGSGAFSANNITEIRLPKNSTFNVIPPALFSMNIRMTKVEIPDTITEIGEMAFAGARLTMLNIPSSVTKVGRKAFHLHHLTELTIPGNVAEIGESAFEGTYKEQTLRNLNLSEGIRTIGKYAFKEGLLTTVTLPSSLEEMGEEPFLNNSGAGSDHIVTLKTFNEAHLKFNTSAKTHTVELIKDVAQAEVTGLADKTYTGKALTPAPVVTMGSRLLVKGTDYTVAYSNNKNVGTATVTITGKGEYSGKFTGTFRIIPKKATFSKVTKGKKAFTAKWKKQTAKMSKSYITGYQIQYSTSKTFASGNKTVTVSGYKKASRKVSGLKAKTTYYVRIRTYMKVSGTTYYSGWSGKKSVKTK